MSQDEPTGFGSDAPPDISDDESVSPRSHTSSTFDINDLTQTSALFMLKPGLPEAPIPSIALDLDYPNDNRQAYVARAEFPRT